MCEQLRRITYPATKKIKSIINTNLQEDNGHYYEHFLDIKTHIILMASMKIFD